MSYFGTQLRSKIDKNSLTFADVSRVSGLSTATISQICTGKQPSISSENVENILKVFHDPHDVVELAVAHLHDELPSNAKELIEIAPRGSVASVLLQAAADYKIHRLDNEFESAIERARAAIPHNEDLRLAIIDLVNAVCGRPEDVVKKIGKGIGRRAIAEGKRRSNQ